MEPKESGRLMAGAILIVIGLGLLGLQFTEGIGESVTLFFIGALFLAGYLYRRAYGLLIPACILMGLGLGAVGEQTFLAMEGMNNLGLGLGFLAIFLIDRAYTGASHWWPLIPGGILVINGLTSSSGPMADLVAVGWPLLLVAAGLILLFGASEFRRRGYRVQPVIIVNEEKPPGLHPGASCSTEQEERLGMSAGKTVT
jgi:type IV secretory pathway VirB2 component (pilin)